MELPLRVSGRWYLLFYDLFIYCILLRYLELYFASCCLLFLWIFRLAKDSVKRKEEKRRNPTPEYTYNLYVSLFFQILFFSTEGKGKQ